MMDTQRFNETLHVHYQRPTADAVEDALRWWVTANHSMQAGFEENPCNIVLYAFVRLSQLHPELLRFYESLFDDTHPWGQDFLARVLAHAGDDESEKWAKSRSSQGANNDLLTLASGKRRESIRTLPIVTPVQLDLNWMEFFLTGDQTALGEIADSLAERSHVRELLEKWLAKRGFLNRLMRQRRENQIKKLKDETGIFCVGEEILNREDLDYICLQEWSFGNITYRAISEAVKPLPCFVPTTIRRRMGVKMMAKWSLFSNALQHEDVLKFCLRCAEQTPPVDELWISSHLSFLDIAINIHVAKGNEAAALRAAKSFVQIDPHSQRVQGVVKRLSAFQRLDELLSLQPHSPSPDKSIQLETPEVLARCEERSRQAESYYSVCRLEIQSPSKAKEAFWRLTYESPDRFEVCQQVGDDNDRWFTIDGKTLDYLHLIAQAVPETLYEEPAVNQRLKMENILDILRLLRVTRLELNQGKDIVLVSGTLPNVPNLAMDYGVPPNTDCRLSVWIENGEGRPPWLLKYSLRAGPIAIDQAFAGFNDAQVTLEEFD